MESKDRQQDAKIDGKVSFNPRQREKWEKVYGIVGHHSAVHICKWTKDSLTSATTCYKNKFYGIDTHKCAEMTPSAAWCQEACVFCWRPMEWYSRTSMEEEEVDEPAYIIDSVVEQRKKLLSGFGGNANVPRELFDNVFNSFPSHWAISLSGEPTIYPLIGKLISELRSREGVKSIFLVSNGQDSSVFLKMKKEDSLPTQLYISLDAPNEGLFKRINRSIYDDGWERLLATLRLLPSLPTRRVIRYTLIKGLNDKEEHIEEYAKLYNIAKPDYIEVKSYMFLGQSRKRLVMENMADHDYIRAFSESLLSHLPDYEWRNEEESSRIVLLKRKDSPFKDIIRAPHPLHSLREGAEKPSEWGVQ
ncbi:MAG: 4-demethylwyosine synthase TYW1 [Methanobacteriota archaeon]|nr:MAG: 4-demethylwyosine synthase TYW1 [Euryarchaeota archaeon]